MVEIRVAVIDDNKKDLTKICDYFEQIESPLYLCDRFQTLQPSFFDRYDIWVIDIELDQTNGLEIAQKIRTIYPQAILIFHSKRNDLVFESLKIGCFFFVRKDHFEEDMDFIQLRLQKHFSDIKKEYVYHSKDQIRKISYEEIEYIEKIGHQIEIHLENQEILKERKSLKDIMKEIDSPVFLQCHQSYYVNLSKVMKLDQNDFILENNKVQISKRYLLKVKKEYMKYLCSCAEGL